MENPVGFPDDCVIVGSVPVSSHGGFTKTLWYIEGHRPKLDRFGSVRFITGIRGLETEILVCRIKPCHQFEVVEPLACAA